MYYARVKINRRLITPDDAHKGVRYECPACDGEVSLRSGYFNRPHFAHANGEANPDCENYHPSQGFYHNPSANIERFFEARHAYIYLPKQPSLTLLNKGDDGVGFAIKIPAIPNATKWDGKIVINGKLGRQTLSSSSFRVTRYIPVHPSSETYAFEKRGDVEEGLWRVYESGVAGLSVEAKNFFSYAETGGRKLQRNEAVFRDEKYWAVVHESLAEGEIPADISRYIHPISTLHGWRIYRVEMPFGPLMEETEEQLEQWLERYIEDRQPSINFWRTYPVRMSGDGTFIFPKETRFLSFKVSSEGLDISIRHSCSTAPEYAADEDNYRIFFEEDPDGEICVFVEGAPRLWIAFEQCRWFEPEGIKLLAGDVAYPLFRAGEALEQANRSPVIGVSLSIPHEKAANALSINGKPYDEQTTDIVGLLRDPYQPLIIDGGNFGKARFDKHIDIKREIFPAEEVLHKIQWLVSINNKGIDGKGITFPCQIDAWWTTMPKEALPLRHGRWNAAYYPHLLYLKDKLETLYENRV